jgi:beta-1,3-galactosyltransferase 1/2/3/4/5/7/8
VSVCVFLIRLLVPALQALTERQPQPEKKAPRARPMSGKAVVMLCATSFFVGLLLSGRTALLTPPSSDPSGHGSRIHLFADDCDQSRRVRVQKPCFRTLL